MQKWFSKMKGVFGLCLGSQRKPVLQYWGSTPQASPYHYPMGRRRPVLPTHRVLRVVYRIPLLRVKWAPAALTQTVENRSCKPDDPGARPGGGSVEVTHYSPQCVTAGSNPAGMESSDFSDERVGGPQWTGGGIGRHKRECHPEQGKVRGW